MGLDCEYMEIKASPERLHKHCRRHVSEYVACCNSPESSNDSET